MKQAIALFVVMVATALAMAGPSDIWQRGGGIGPEVIVLQGTTVAEVSKADTVYKFTAKVTTVDGEVIPMYIEGITRAGDGGRPTERFSEPQPVEGWRPIGSWGWSEDVTVFVSVKFEDDVELQSFVFRNESGDYRREIELDEFFGTDHKFKAGEEYGVGIPL
jgi:hypothetical protein